MKLWGTMPGKVLQNNMAVLPDGGEKKTRRFEEDYKAKSYCYN